MKKIVIYGSVFLLVTAIAFPLTAEAFSRRPQSSEVYQNQQARSTPAEKKESRTDHGQPHGQPHAVPEPSPLVLVGIAGIGLGIVHVMRKRFRGVVVK